MFIVDEDHKIMDDFKITNKVEVTNVYRPPGDKDSIECRAVVLLKNIDVAIEYTHFTTPKGGKPHGRFSSYKYKDKEGNEQLISNVQVVSPVDDKVGWDSFVLTRKLEKMVANALEKHFDQDTSDVNMVEEAADAVVDTEKAATIKLEKIPV